MARELPELQVVENHLPRHHPGSQFRAGYVLRPRDSERGSDSDLAALYAPLILDGDENTGDVAAAVDPDLPLVRANFITSLDGSVTGADGKSGSINGPADLRVFQLLRAQSDAVFVGAGTARIEGYQDTDIPEGLQPLRDDAHPRLITVTRSGQLDPAFLAARPLIITAQGHPAASMLAEKVPADDLLIFGAQAVDFRAALRELKQRGYANILCEGGPHLMGSLVEHGLVSELCLSFSPQIVGGDGYRFMVGDLSPTAARLQVLLSSQDGYLISRWQLQP